jgi:hypothetical protein
LEFIDTHSNPELTLRVYVYAMAVEERVLAFANLAPADKGTLNTHRNDPIRPLPFLAIPATKTSPT